MKNIACDTHIHSKYSWDSKSKLEDIISIAEDKKLDYIAITDHVEFSNQPVKEVIHRIQIRNEAIDRLQENTKIKIIKGVEISEPHLYREELLALRKINDLDYILGSIHHILGMPIGKVAHIKNITNYYLENIRKMVESSDIDTIAHLDYLKRYLKQGEFDKDILNKILETIIRNDIALEINTSGYKRCNEEFPSHEILSLYHALGGKKVTYGSDAHTSFDVFEGIPQAKEENKDLELSEGIVIKRRFRSIK